MGKFSWGRVLERFEYDFDGEVMSVTKYHPWKLAEDGFTCTREPNEAEVMYHCEELRESCDTLYALLISWIAHKRLGQNQHALVSGICRALAVEG